MLWTDYRLPVEPIRAEVSRLCKQDKDWDGRVGIVQVTDTSEQSMQLRSEEHTSELQSLMRSSYAVFCLKKKIVHTSVPRTLRDKTFGNYYYNTHNNNDNDRTSHQISHEM